MTNPDPAAQPPAPNALLRHTPGECPLCEHAVRLESDRHYVNHLTNAHAREDLAWTLLETEAKLFALQRLTTHQATAADALLRHLDGTAFDSAHHQEQIHVPVSLLTALAERCRTDGVSEWAAELETLTTCAVHEAVAMSADTWKDMLDRLGRDLDPEAVASILRDRP